MANANPTIISSQIGNGNATQVSANCRADQYLSASGRVQTNLTNLIKESCLRKLILLLNFLKSQSSNKDWGSIPNNLKNLSGRNFRNVDFKISISIISCPPVKPTDDSNCIESGKVGYCCIVNSTQHINLSSSDVSFMLIVNSVLIKPIIKVGLKIDVISEVAWSCRRHEEVLFIRDRMVVIQFLA